MGASFLSVTRSVSFSQYCSFCLFNGIIKTERYLMSSGTNKFCFKKKSRSLTTSPRTNFFFFFYLVEAESRKLPDFTSSSSKQPSYFRYLICQCDVTYFISFFYLSTQLSIRLLFPLSAPFLPSAFNVAERRVFRLFPMLYRPSGNLNHLLLNGPRNRFSDLCRSRIFFSFSPLRLNF